MANSILRTANGVDLPAPTEISVGNEIIWSSNTGRTSSGKMVGTAIAQKDTLSIKWGVLSDSDYNLLRTNMKKSFFNIYFYDVEIEVYRGTLTGECLGYIGDGTNYWRSANVDLVQR
jgi:hypothetical protein